MEVIKTLINNGLFVDIIKLLLYINYVDTTIFYLCQIKTKLSLNVLLETKCSNVVNIMGYLLSFDDMVEVNNIELRNDYAYIMELLGYDENGKSTNISHAFIIVDDYVVESYINNKSVDINKIGDVELLNNTIKSLGVKYNKDTWKVLTNYIEPDDNTKIIKSMTMRYKYDTQKIINKINELIDISIHKLTKTDENIGMKYLIFLSENLEYNEALSYLSEFKDEVNKLFT
jgi:hypothetical protein